MPLRHSICEGHNDEGEPIPRLYKNHRAIHYIVSCSRTLPFSRYLLHLRNLYTHTRAKPVALLYTNHYCHVISTMFFKFTFVAAAAALLAAVHASPLKISPVEDDVYSPPITSPSVFSVWTVGSNQTVTWNTASIPSENQNSTGLLLLGYQEDNNEHLDISEFCNMSFRV